MSNTRVNQFYTLNYIKDMNGLPEALVRKEEELEEYLGTNFTFSKTVFNIGDEELQIGRVNEWYFLNKVGSTYYDVFEDYKLIKMHIISGFGSALESNDKLSRDILAFWIRELEKL